MTVSLTLLPKSISASAQVTFTFDVAKNTSESGVSGRKAMRPVIRNYMATVSPEDSAEMQAIIMATFGARYPFAMRDYSNYQLTDEVLTHSSGVAKLGKTWAPATGSLSVYERILVPDTSETPLVIKVAGSPIAYTVADFGLISGSFSDGDTVTATGQFLTPVCMVDQPSATMYTSHAPLLITTGVPVVNTTTYQFADMHLEQIFENELIALTS